MLLRKKAVEGSVGEALSGDEDADTIAPTLTLDEMIFLMRVERASERRGGPAAQSLLNKRLISRPDSEFKLTPEGHLVISVLHRLRQGWE
jgi:hypothetical protein